MKELLNGKNLLIVVLMCIVFVMAVGFAGFSQRLTITETSGFDSNWNVYISDAAVDWVYGEGDGTANVTARDMATITTTLKYPGDGVEYLITVKNDGNVDAVLEDINLNVVNQDSVIKYSLYDLEKDEIDLTTGIEIPSETEYKFLVIVEYDTNLTGTATEAQKSNGVTLDLDFVQKSE